MAEGRGSQTFCTSRQRRAAPTISPNSSMKPPVEYETSLVFEGSGDGGGFHIRLVGQIDQIDR